MQNEDKRRQEKMLKELERVKTHHSAKHPEVSPLENALKKFENENGYGFLDMIFNDKCRKKHDFKNMQKTDNDDDDFLELFQDYQGG
ncbi:MULTISPECIES: hypothetical protein [Bacillus]|uniref:hypothetical protein n=1 Tax=Bacillus TaxID=1386 RepID=UPI0002E6134C|nr:MULTISPECIES: hypothetical protein [Bacillus]MCY7479814.1 hypothetical protein [Bacillus safensis]MCY7513623.1 hypothetical protein [Bacillus safensis]MED0719114.1 hypothetical protein [Bacillus safensis]MED4747499.1 hypothetical protein [Bacillus safensis]